MNEEQITFDGIPIPLTMKTILDAMVRTRLMLFDPDINLARAYIRKRQYRAFRARIIRMYNVRGAHIDLLYKAEELRDEQVAEKAARIERWIDAANQLQSEIDVKDTRIAELEDS